MLFSNKSKPDNVTEVKMNGKYKSLSILTVTLIFGITSLAFAGWGGGYCHMMGAGGWGPGRHHMGGYGYDQRGYDGNLSEQQMQNLDQQRAEFFKATENLRQQLYQKELDLRSELAKENPETSKASSLQSEISKLQGELDQKRLDYEIQARKTAPNYQRDDRGYGPMMGYGPRGGGYCRW
jgi:zinc resistance-associated protein